MCAGTPRWASRPAPWNNRLRSASRSDTFRRKNLGRGASSQRGNNSPPIDSLCLTPLPICNPAPQTMGTCLSSEQCYKTDAAPVSPSAHRRRKTVGDETLRGGTLRGFEAARFEAARSKARRREASRCGARISEYKVTKREAMRQSDTSLDVAS